MFVNGFRNVNFRVFYGLYRNQFSTPPASINSTKFLLRVGKLNISRLTRSSIRPSQPLRVKVLTQLLFPTDFHLTARPPAPTVKRGCDQPQQYFAGFRC